MDKMMKGAMKKKASGRGLAMARKKYMARAMKKGGKGRRRAPMMRK